MNEEILNNLPIIAIITPIAIAFVIGLFKNKYMNLKSLCYSSIISKRNSHCIDGKACNV